MSGTRSSCISAETAARCTERSNPTGAAATTCDSRSSGPAPRSSAIIAASLTVLENLAAYAGLYRRPTEDPGRLLERVGLLEASDQPAGSLSKGMQMRLNLARAMLPRPEILFLG